jgi:phosphatidylserine/phosphatidylglycerophosphate/cardiolipin synthase-like enzyme
MRAELTARNGWRFRTDNDLRDGVVGKTLVSVLDGASRAIDIASAHFRRKDIFDAVQRASARGVIVRLVLDGQELDYLDSQTKCETLDERAVFLDECLALNSPTAEVRYKIYSHRFSAMTAKLLHSKYIIIDGTVLFTGSFNLSYNSELNSFENLIRFEDEEVIGQYRENFEKLFGYGAGQLDALKAEVAAAAGAGPCVFPPFSLTAPQIWELRNLYQRGACSANNPR